MSSGRKQYPFNLIEPKWQHFWEEQQTFRAFNPGEVLPDSHPFAQRHGLAGKKASAANLPEKFYVLDMFPYPSGAGLHVGHPEGYTATDILARYKRAQGRHVLHPMGWDAFGLPAEQYAIKTGQHPRQTTEENIATFKRQIKSLGFSYDWTREVDTTDPKYFKWTQWIFLKLYNSWFNPETNRAEPMETLKYPAELEQRAASVPLANPERQQDAGGTLEARRRVYRDSKRLAYVAEAPMWWCEQLGTVLANEEVVDGKSEVGDFPVVRKPMRQWMLRITAYAEKLLNDLDTIDWSDSLKEMQRNWIGKSEGAEVDFAIADCRLPIADSKIRVFTTRPDTLFGATYMVLSPEHKLLADIVTPEQRDTVKQYQQFAAGRSDLERTELAKEKTGVFTGAWAINPVIDPNNPLWPKQHLIPIWIADYVLASYGTGAIMAVPSHDARDMEFALKFDITTQNVVLPSDDWLSARVSSTFKDKPIEEIRDVYRTTNAYFGQEAFVGEGIAINSRNPEISLNALPTAEAKKKITAWLESKGLGKKTINYKLRDWLFSRQRYWGEPFPIVWKKDANGNVYHEALPESALPVLPPPLDDYKPTPDGQPPLARAQDWVNLPDGSVRETNTMPQWAGSCWYYLRYLEPDNQGRFVNSSAEKYWMGGHLPPFPRTPQQWQKEMRELYRYARGRKPAERRRLAFGYIDAPAAEKLRALTGLDLRGLFHVVDSFAVNHILKQHGSDDLKEPRGQLGVHQEDFELLPAVVAAPDRVEVVGKTHQGLPVIAFAKRVNGFMVVVEEVRTGSNQLSLVTMYKRKWTASGAAIGACSITSETLRPGINYFHLLSYHKPEIEPPQFLSPEHRDSMAAGASPVPGVDLYVGGTEHAVLHLLYARFWHKVLFDLGHVSTPEPFFKLVNQGLILGEDGQKMSKSRGNVINPDDILVEYGADALRLYEMFMGPLEMVKPWNTKGVEGVYRFLGRVWRLFVDEKSEVEFEQAMTTAKTESREELLALIQLIPVIRDTEPTKEQLKVLHACIRKVTEDLDGLRFNTAISAMMVFVNEATAWETRPALMLREFLILLQPFAPHIAEELWEKLSNVQRPTSKVTDVVATTWDLGLWTLDLAYQPWPKHNPALLVEDTLEIPVQVNGKLRDVIRVPAGASPQDIEGAALKAGKAQPFLDGKTVKKVIVVPKKLVNIVVG